MMLHRWIVQKKFWLGLLLFPLPLHLLPTLNYIPEWVDTKDVLFLSVSIAVILFYVASLVLFWRTSSLISKTKKIILTVISSLALLGHAALFFFIVFTYSFDLGTQVATFTDEVKGRRIYVLSNSGLFHIHFNTQIAYKRKYLPLYKVKYSTNNYLEFKEKGTDWIIFNEYENIPVQKETKDLFDLLKKRETRPQHIKDYLLNINNLE